MVLDCRNSYESEIGIFQNAIPLNTTFFRESWDALDEVLKDKPKDAPIMTYCTGGIRCVKINAYIEQELGFTNVGRLEGGIISYTKELEANSLGAVSGMKTQNDQVGGISGSGNDRDGPVHLSRDVGSISKFKGTNYVFDERMGARITSDVLAQCETCGQGCDLFKNCENYDCHVRFIQCEACIDNYKGCCCYACEKKYDEQEEEEKSLLLVESMRRKAKLEKDRNLMPIPRSVSKRSTAVRPNGVTDKQIIEAAGVGGIVKHEATSSSSSSSS